MKIKFRWHEFLLITSVWVWLLSTQVLISCSDYCNALNSPDCGLYLLLSNLHVGNLCAIRVVNALFFKRESKWNCMHGPYFSFWLFNGYEKSIYTYYKTVTDGWIRKWKKISLSSITVLICCTFRMIYNFPFVLSVHSYLNSV